MRFSSLKLLTALLLVPACATGDVTDTEDSTAQESTATTQTFGLTKFAVRIEGISDAKQIVLPDGSTIAAPIAPGLIVVSPTDNLLFRAGQPSSTRLEALAEDGDPSALIANMLSRPDVRDAQFVIPNLHYQVLARPGDRLYFANMFVHSNDLFYSFSQHGLPLFNNLLQPVSGDKTSLVSLWDAGTEQNEVPGVGPQQAPRQPFAGSGVETSLAMNLVGGDGFSYPPTANVIRVTVSPVQ